MTDITVIILIGQEKIHLKRCVEKLASLKPRQIFLVESQPDDGGVAIAKETAARLGLRLESRFNKWPGLYAQQLNWALENLPIEAEWVMRLDADEYFLPEAVEELKEKLPKLPADVTGVISKRRHYIFGGWAKHGTYPVKLLRVFRNGKAICEERYMDEHMQLKEGRAVEFEYDFIDHNLSSFEWWQEKHRGYAKREAMDALEIMAELKSGAIKPIRIDGQAALKRARKYRYYKLPRYLRAVMLFFVRYFLKGGFLDGKTGLMWNFWQGLWYRWLVDREIGRLLAGQEKEPPKVSLCAYRHPYGDVVGRFLWEVVWTFGGRWTPRWALNGWRRLLMSAFGAKIGKGVRLEGGAAVWQPWCVKIGANSWVDGEAKLYSVDEIRIGHDVVVSEGAFICTASHDLASGTFALTKAPIEIGDYAWICAHAIILPGVKVGEGAVVASGAVVTKDVEPWTVVGGVPAKEIKKRNIEV